MTPLLFDSNILIDGLRNIREGMAEIDACRDRYISRITWIEVLAGATANDAERIEEFLSLFTIVEITEDVARRAARIRERGRRPHLMDVLILASAQAIGATLVTRNTKDFPADMPGILVPYTL